MQYLSLIILILFSLIGVIFTSKQLSKSNLLREVFGSSGWHTIFITLVASTLICGSLLEMSNAGIFLGLTVLFVLLDGAIITVVGLVYFLLKRRWNSALINLILTACIFGVVTVRVFSI